MTNSSIEFTSGTWNNNQRNYFIDMAWTFGRTSEGGSQLPYNFQLYSNCRAIEIEIIFFEAFCQVLGHCCPFWYEVGNIWSKPTNENKTRPDHGKWMIHASNITPFLRERPLTKLGPVFFALMWPWQILAILFNAISLLSPWDFWIIWVSGHLTMNVPDEGYSRCLSCARN